MGPSIKYIRKILDILCLHFNQPIIAMYRKTKPFDNPLPFLSANFLYERFPTALSPTDSLPASQRGNGESELWQQKWI